MITDTGQHKTDTAVLSTERRLLDAADSIRDQFRSEGLTRADINAMARCRDELRRLIACVKAVCDRDGCLSGWGVLAPVTTGEAPGDQPPSEAAALLRGALDRVIRTEDPASLSAVGLRRVFDEWNEVIGRANAVLGCQRADAAHPNLLRGWRDDQQQVWRHRP